MPESCCRKPIAKIIKVGDFEAGITGLERAFEEVMELHETEQVRIKDLLFQKVVQFGNYISPGTEKEYKEALLREYEAFRRKKAK